MKIQFAEGELRAEVKKELDRFLPDAVEQGLRDLPFEMVCAHQNKSQLFQMTVYGK